MKPTPKSYQELVDYYADILPLLSTARKIALEAGMEDNIIDLLRSQYYDVAETVDLLNHKIYSAEKVRWCNE
jgi:hypothetical protein